VGDLHLRCGGEEEVYGAAFVGFEMTEDDPAQSFQWQQ
jgi:hypothetical protein